MSAATPAVPTLAGRFPEVTPARLLAELVPPPQFDGATFESYRIDGQHPGQARARDRVAALAQTLSRSGGARGGRSWFGRPRKAEPAALYLDGGFGVGKTHLLAALAHAVGPAAAVYGTFVEITNLVGALGFAPCVRELAGHALVCVDEFELDDPGDTLIMTRLVRELGDAGVSVVATSNTLPEALGEGRFAAEDFLREIQGLARRFEVLRIDGPDYRHRGGVAGQEPLTDAQVRERLGALPGATVDDLGALLAHLARVHPSRYGALLDEVRAVGLTGVRPVDDDAAGLRLVVLVDRLYDRGIPVRLGGAQPHDLFDPRMLAGGYRKKYLRALSRVGSLATRATEGEPYEI